MVLISLIGEQPAPNLLPARRLGPEAMVLVYTRRTQTIAKNLNMLLRSACTCLPCEVDDPYRIPQIYDRLREFIDDRCPHKPLVFNLTGGTKPMVMAAYRLARERRSPFVYFRTEGNRSRLYHYTFHEERVVLEKEDELAETISLDDYLRAYLGTYETGDPREPFEEAVFDVLSSTPGLEAMSSLRPQGLGALEIDFVVRHGNQVGIGEVKQKGAKRGIDQINAVAHPNYLGTYIAKFLVSARPVDRNNRALAEAYGIEVIELPGYQGKGTLDPANRKELRRRILKRLGGGL